MRHKQSRPLSSLRSPGARHIYSNRNARKTRTHVHPLALDAHGAMSGILEQLPLQKVVEMSLVCRLWRSMVRSELFQQRWLEKHSRRWVVVSESKKPRPRVDGRRELLAYDEWAESWISLSDLLHRDKIREGIDDPELEVLGGRLLWNVLDAHAQAREAAPSERLLVAGSSHTLGLLCFACYEPEDLELSVIVINPLTARRTLLPSPSSALPCSLPSFLINLSSCYLHLAAAGGIASDPGHSYNVFLFCQFKSRDYRCALLTHSSSSSGDAWRLAASPYTAANHVDLADGATLQFLEDADFFHLHPYHRCILAYTLKTDRWGVCRVPERMCDEYNRSGGFFDGVFFRHRGRLLLAAPVQTKYRAEGGAGEGHGVVGFCIYEMMLRRRTQCNDGDATQYIDWVVIAETPHHLCHPKTLIKSVRFVYGSGQVWMTTNTRISGKGGKYWAPIVYDVDAEEWRHFRMPNRPWRYQVMCVVGVSISDLGAAGGLPAYELPPS